MRLRLFLRKMMNKLYNALIFKASFIEKYSLVIHHFYLIVNFFIIKLFFTVIYLSSHAVG